ncbi:MAG: ABC-ATPase UvrA [Candidatus Omnitrophota bacterium]
MSEIEIIGAKKHNLKDISLRIPKRQLICITGVSGSGKSTLAFDTIFQEGQRKYLESLSIYARQFIKSLEKPEVQSIRGLSPTISIDQKHSSYYFNSTVGTISEINYYLRLLLTKAGEARCPQCGKVINSFSTRGTTDYVFDCFCDQLVYIYAPVVKNRKGVYKSLLEKYLKRGFSKALIDGTVHYLDDLPNLGKNTVHHISILIDVIKISSNNRKQLEESIALASVEGQGEIILMVNNQDYFFSSKLFCSTCNVSLREPQPATFSINSPVAVCATCSGKQETESGDSCPDCHGSGFNEWPLSFYFRGKNIFELGEMEITDLLSFFKTIRLHGNETIILEPLMPQILQRLESFVKLNLGYITLNRKINTLSGGELQRTRLVSQIGFSLSGIVYILDEPSIGMHMIEEQNLIDILKNLKEKDNTVIVVEHDELTIGSSDFIVDLGPGAGEKGGYLIYSGWFKDFENASGSLTADYMFKRKQVIVEKGYKCCTEGSIEFSGISINNVNEAEIRIPLKSLTVVTGVSGSGKSSLIVDALYPIVKKALGDEDILRTRYRYSGHEGIENLSRVMMVTQTAIGKNARSCPATYIDIMPMIRDLFAGLMESKMRGYTQARFSFNVSGGRCEACKGLGYKKLEMSFLPELEVPCPVCDGKRYNSETLRVKYDGLSIAEVLELTAVEAYELFKNIPILAKKIKILLDVGLGYLKLGQSSVTLSGGESQRIKLTKELSRLSSKPTLYVMDEPTIGLHFNDIQNLIDVLHGLIMKGNTVIVIEHNMEMIKASDYIIDLGPGGGKNGGNVLYQGKPDGLKTVAESVTGRYL